MHVFGLVRSHLAQGVVLDLEQENLFCPVLREFLVFPHLGQQFHDLDVPFLDLLLEIEDIILEFIHLVHHLDPELLIMIHRVVDKRRV